MNGIEHSRPDITERNVSVVPGLSRVLRLLSIFKDRASFGSKMGLSHYRDGKYQRDLYKAFGLKESLDIADYRSWYERGGLASTIVEIWPNETWRGSTMVIEDESPNTQTRFEEDTKELANRLDLYGAMESADILLNLGRYSCVLIGVSSQLELSKLSTELPNGNGQVGNISYLRPLAEDEISIREREGDENSPRWGMPTVYDLVGARSGRKRVHWSRVLHYVEGSLGNPVYGRPILEKIHNDLMALFKQTQGSAEAVFRNADPKVLFDKEHFDTGGKEVEDFLAGIATDDPDTDNDGVPLEDEITAMFDGYSKFAFTSGVTPKQLIHRVINIRSNNMAVIDQIAGAIQVPTRILIGSQSGQRASNQDENRFEKKARSRQDRHGARMLRQTLDRLIEYGYMSVPKQYEVRFARDVKLNEDIRRAELSSKIADANKKQTDQGDATIITSAEMRRDIFDKGPLEASDLPVSTNEDVTQYTRNVDVDRDEPEWKVIHDVANSHEDEVAGLFELSWEMAVDQMPRLTENLGDRNTDDIIADLSEGLSISYREDEDGSGVTLQEDMERMFLLILNDAAFAALRLSEERGSLFRSSQCNTKGFRRLQFSAEFDVTNLRSIQFASLRSSTLVTEVSTSTVAAIRQLIGFGFDAGIAPVKLATYIKSAIGLRADQVAQLWNLITTLSSEGVSQSIINSRVGLLASRLRSERALLIARTETINSAVQGQNELWQQAIESGDLPSDIKRVLIVTQDERNADCPICPPSDGQIRGMNEPFITGLGESKMHPTFHPNCRCSVGLATPGDLERAGL